MTLVPTSLRGSDCCVTEMDTITHISISFVVVWKLAGICPVARVVDSGFLVLHEEEQNNALLLSAVGKVAVISHKMIVLHESHRRRNELSRRGHEATSRF